MSNWKRLPIKDNEKIYEILMDMSKVRQIRAFYDEGKLVGSGLFMDDGTLVLTPTSFSEFSAELVPTFVEDEPIVLNEFTTKDGESFGAKMAAARAAKANERKTHQQTSGGMTSSAI